MSELARGVELRVNHRVAILRSVPDGERRFILDGGEMLALSEGELEQVYELLWQLAPKPGAVPLAAVIRGTARADLLYGPPVSLEASQSAAMREAVALLRVSWFVTPARVESVIRM